MIFEGESSVDVVIHIRSRMVLGESVKQQSLDIITEPSYFPLIVKTFARFFEKTQRNEQSQHHCLVFSAMFRAARNFELMYLTCQQIF